MFKIQNRKQGKRDRLYYTRRSVPAYVDEYRDNRWTKKYIYDKYPNTRELHCYIKEFRNIFKKRNIPLLYLFVEKYSKSTLKPLKSFAEGLKRDMDAVENAVAYDYSNGFVEGTNSRLKMIKRTMYDRCGKQLLEAKLRYIGIDKNGQLRKKLANQNIQAGIIKFWNIKMNTGIIFFNQSAIY